MLVHHWALRAALVALAQSATAGPLEEPLQQVYNIAPSDKTSYRARVLDGYGVRSIDPNVYVYTSAFGERFQMPQEWESDELQGAVAAAFRVVPREKTCGWNGDTNLCREDQFRCELDLYFDTKSESPVWDKRVVKSNGIARTSARYIESRANRIPGPASDISTDMPRLPLMDPQSGAEVQWYSADGGTTGVVPLLSYHREIFHGIAMVKLQSHCTSPVAYWLSNKYEHDQYIETSPDIAYRVLFPADWQERVAKSLEEPKKRVGVFSDRKGERVPSTLDVQRQGNVNATPQE